MTGIWVLPQEIVGRIAAGEVVERPLNIVKELIENSIDANSTKIYIRITNGGLDGVQVQDDGEGIPSKEVALAFQLHSTSKLKDENIGNVATLGFRGEALASMTAVSLVNCSTVHDGVISEIILEGGQIKNQFEKSTSLPNGTSISVSSLFFNTPVRKKFLKQPATERKKIIELVTHFNLSYPSIHFILEEINPTGKSQIRLDSPSRKGLLAVVYDVLGAEIANSLIPIQGQLTNWHVEGYISKPNLVKSDRSTQYVCVNGRVIKHGELQSKIENAYGSQLLKSSYPVIVLNLRGASFLVDFNIHPQKTEIRFQNEDPILEELSELISNSLEIQSDLQFLPKSSLSRVKPSQAVRTLDSLDKPTTNISFATGSKSNSRSFYQTSLVANPSSISKSGVKVLGHIMNKFAIIEGLDDELWLVDVHAADERVKFEYFSQSSHRKALSQQMLEPFNIELLPSEKAIIIENSTHFEKYGLKISDGSGKSVLVHSLPVYFDQVLTIETIKKLFDDIISFLSDPIDSSSIVESPFDKIEYGIVARLACHGSIRSGYSVSNAIITDVIENLLKCSNPWTCAHGRPTVLKLSKSTLEGWFKR